MRIDDENELLNLIEVVDKEGLDGGDGLVLKGELRLGTSLLETCRPMRVPDREQCYWGRERRMLGTRTYWMGGERCQQPCRHACLCHQTTLRRQTAAGLRASSQWIRSCEKAYVVVMVRARFGAAVKVSVWLFVSPRTQTYL